MERAFQAKSNQMSNIVTRLLAYGDFDIVHFGDEVILHHPVEDWPTCDYLLSWTSTGKLLAVMRERNAQLRCLGFPLAKAQQYIALRKVPTMNDLDMQVRSFDRFSDGIFPHRSCSL